jgi:hypothetical protein
MADDWRRPSVLRRPRRCPALSSDSQEEQPNSDESSGTDGERRKIVEEMCPLGVDREGDRSEEVMLAGQGSRYRDLREASVIVCSIARRWSEPLGTGRDEETSAGKLRCSSLRV